MDCYQLETKLSGQAFLKGGISGSIVQFSVNAGKVAGKHCLSSAGPALYAASKLRRRKWLVQDIQTWVKVPGRFNFLRESASNEHDGQLKLIFQVLCDRHTVPVFFGLKIENGQGGFVLSTGILQINQRSSLNDLMPLVFQDLSDFHRNNGFVLR